MVLYSLPVRVGKGLKGCLLSGEHWGERREDGNPLNYHIIYCLYIYYSRCAHRPCLVMFGSCTAYLIT